MADIAKEGSQDLVSAKEGSQGLMSAKEGSQDLVSAKEGSQHPVSAKEGSQDLVSGGQGGTRLRVSLNGQLTTVELARSDQIHPARLLNQNVLRS